jgi:hypothetical protein
MAALLTRRLRTLLFVFRPATGSMTTSVVWGIAGYPGGGETVPFVVYSNILLGLALAPLYALRTSANWFVLLLILLNAGSTYSLLWLILAAKRRAPPAILGCIAILLGVAALTINVTYTMTAFLASVAGVLLLLAWARRSEQYWWPLAATPGTFV